MPLHTKDDEKAELVGTLAKHRGLKRGAAVKGELGSAVRATPLRERFAALRAANPLPPPAGGVADKAFFDDLPGE
jgi:hypothetical protein